MQAQAKEVIGFVSEKMGISPEEAQDALCIGDKEMVIELQSEPDKNRYAHVIEHDLDTSKVEIGTIAKSLGLNENELSVYVEDNMIWILYGPNIVEGIVGEGPNAKLATASFYREWYKEKVVKTS